jgi:hypothetical protein
MINSIPFPDTPFKVNEVFQTERGIFVGQLTTRKIAHGIPVFGLSCPDSDYIPLLKNALNLKETTTMATEQQQVRTHKCTVLDSDLFTNNNPYSFIINKEKRGTVWGVEIHFPYNSAGYNFTKDSDSKDFDISQIHYVLKFHTLKDKSNPLGGSFIDDLKEAGFNHSKNNPYLFYKGTRSETEANALFSFLKEQVSFYYDESLDRLPRQLHPDPEPTIKQQVTSVVIDETAIAQKVVETILSSDRFMDVLAERIAAKINIPDYGKSMIQIYEMQQEIVAMVSRLSLAQTSQSNPEPEDIEEDELDEELDYENVQDYEDECESEIEPEEPSGVYLEIPVYSQSVSDEDLASNL